ncbi:helix-turn-helix domain-containing protein [Sphaerisporangium sp. TRM90804]|uniref:winged helix-turn-helix transcriptional regulator n=1 Tax=Sphaerisporangium sp. TRM90804 TaxID=3031113 RepID=UPI0024495EC5|nr:helix-turn-helix domain-containing protein [Sphaerisporangium sp. TRM90804]MDH2430343.1 helix-turn-helix domain-containing protein [Sphaerisporangium sp. TRM90804]
MSDRRSYGDACGVARGLDIVGERWALLVVRDLLLGPKRFNDLLGGLRGVSPNVLSQRLRDLVEHGVVRRRDLGAPARVHLYELTEWGRELEPLLLRFGRWGSRAPMPPDAEIGIDSLLLSVKTAFDPARSGEPPAAYELRVDADTYLVEVTGGSVQISRGTAAARPCATLTTDLGTLRAVCGNLVSVADATRDGLLRLDGGEEATRRLTELLLAPFSPPPREGP